MSLRPRLTRDAGDGGAAWDVPRAAEQGSGARDDVQGSAAQDASRIGDARFDTAQDASRAADDATFYAAQGASRTGDARFDTALNASRAADTTFSAAHGASCTGDARFNTALNASRAADATYSASQGASRASDMQFNAALNASRVADTTNTRNAVHTPPAQPTPDEAPPISRRRVETYAPERPSDLYGRRRVVRGEHMSPALEKPSLTPSTPPSVERYGIPDNPFAPQGEGQPRRRSRAARAQSTEASATQSAAPTASPLAREQGFPPRAPWTGAGAVLHASNDPFSANRQSFAPQVDPQADGASAPASAPNASFAPTQAPPSPATAAPSQTQVFVTQDGSQFEAPARPEVPDWLRVAQQNNLPLRRPQAPRVTAAPRPSDDVEAPQRDPLGRPLHRASRHADASVSQPTSYPPDAAPQRDPLGRPLHRAARHADASASQPTSYPPDAALHRDPLGRPLHRSARHAGANASPAPATPLSPDSLQERARSYAEAPADMPPPPADNPPPATFQRAPRTRAASDKPSAPTRRPLLAWMSVAVLLAAAVAVGLWLAQLSFKGQTQGVLDARQAAYDAVVEAHPLRYQALIEEKAGKYNLSPAFVAAIVLNESSFRPDATSSVGARGLMQLVDKTASWVHDKLELPTPYSFDALYEPETNVEYGCWYLSFLCNRFRGDPVLVAAAYHAGQGEVQNWLNDSRYSSDNLTIELENMMDGPTKQYTARVVSDYAVYKRLYYPSSEDSP